MEKLALLDLPDHVYNWLADFCTGHLHCTVYHGQVSTLKSITASIIQDSGIGPAAYVIYASDVKAVTPGNQLRKFADDTYLIVPASNVDSRAAEMNNIDTWAQKNNLTLNRKKSQEIVFTDPRRRRQIALPLPMADIIRVTFIKILGVTITNGLSASDHVRDVITSCAQTLYALRVLQAPTACVRRLCRPGQSLLPSCSMHPVPGVDLPKRLTSNESTGFFVAASVVVTACLTSSHLLINVPPLMKTL